MEKKIIHQQIPIDDKGRYLLTVEEITNFHKAIRNNLPDGYHLITSPFPTKILEEDDIIQIDSKTYTYQELLDIIDIGD